MRFSNAPLRHAVQNTNEQRLRRVFYKRVILRELTETEGLIILSKLDYCLFARSFASLFNERLYFNNIGIETVIN